MLNVKLLVHHVTSRVSKFNTSEMCVIAVMMVMRHLQASQGTAPLNCLKVFEKMRCGVAVSEVADCLAKKVIRSSARYLHGIFVILGCYAA